MAAYTTIDDPSAYFKVQLYTGTGSSHAITFNDTDTEMQPDLVWNKSRSDTYSHNFCDSVRGVTKMLEGESDAAENTNTNAVTAFGSDGFTVGSDNGNNKSSSNFVAWCWKAGTTSGITTNGSTDITPSAYSFNATSRFSIVQYAGATTAGQLAHGLGVTPTFHMIKKTSGTGNWQVYVQATGNGGTLALNQNYALDSNAYYYNNTDPDSVNITLGSGSSNTSVNTSGQTYICYSFADVQGFSKAGKYTGNGNANGVFVNTGFRPAMVIIKVSSTTSSWRIYDTKRDIDNPCNTRLLPNETGADSTETLFDLCSNGFKLRTSDSATNGSGSTYIYMAFAEAPFVNSNGVPCNAR